MNCWASSQKTDREIHKNKISFFLNLINLINKKIITYIPFYWL